MNISASRAVARVAFGLLLGASICFCPLAGAEEADPEPGSEGREERVLTAPEIALEAAPDDAFLLDKAASMRRQAEADEAAALQLFAEEEARCYRKFFVNDCLNTAKRKRVDQVNAARALDLEGRRLEREVKRREVEARQAQREVETKTREEDLAAQGEAFRAEQERRATEREQRVADKERQSEEYRKRHAEEEQARRIKLEERARRDADRAERRAEQERKKAEMLP
ncbi:MAG: hypothetical protein FWD77_10460 [Betaproteobacteria bacterium]|nr:hypothetical protein [Betaproteobacteria bacterium]